MIDNYVMLKEEQSAQYRFEDGDREVTEKLQNLKIIKFIFSNNGTNFLIQLIQEQEEETPNWVLLGRIFNLSSSVANNNQK